MSSPAAAHVLGELRALRRRSAAVTVDAVATMPTLTRLLGAGDPALAYARLQHHLLDNAHERVIKAAAASLGFSSDADTHLGRLEHAGQDLSVDQRHARRLSDEGLEMLAALITSSWLVEAVPSLSLTVIAEPDQVSLLASGEWPSIIEMKEPRFTLYRGSVEPGTVSTDWRRDDRGDVAVVASVSPLSIRRTRQETSVAVTWRGEIWPKFACHLSGRHADVVVETLGNRLMVRLWGADGA